MRKSFSILLLSLIFVSFFSGLVIAASVGSTSSILDNSPSSQIIIVIAQNLNLGHTWKSIIFGLVVLAIIFAGTSDILAITSIFSSTTTTIIAIGLGIIAALSGTVSQITIILLQFAAGFGAGAIFIEIAVSIGIFIALMFGSTKIAMWAARRKMLASEVRATESSGEIAGAMEAEREIFKKALKKK